MLEIQTLFKKTLQFYFPVLFMWHGLICMSWDSVVGIGVRLWAGPLRNCGAVSGWGKIFVHFSKVSRPALRPTEPTGQWVLGTLD
jgi:hypothetical protein